MKNLKQRLNEITSEKCESKKEELVEKLAYELATNDDENTPDLLADAMGELLAKTIIKRLKREPRPADNHFIIEAHYDIDKQGFTTRVKLHGLNKNEALMILDGVRKDIEEKH